VCVLDSKTSRFLDNGKGPDWRVNPAYLSNRAHADFTKIIKTSTLNQLKKALESKTTTSVVHNGLHARNRVVASSAERMVALSWDIDKRSGTEFSWELCSITTKAHKRHVLIT
jgi:hypothetical protein